ncbi:MAG: hypothetical protein CXT73_05345 [Methanobacteriota archaeon]|nr:MAG: hypothetical protein CXT73_05345 [Euryarchaeota archaeon]
MSELITLLEIFGGTGAVLLGMTGCIWRCYQKYHYEIKEGVWDKNIASQTLQNNWETKGDNFPQDKEFGDRWKRNIFAQNVENNDKDMIKVNIDKKHGDVYIYSETTLKPPPLNNGKYYLRVKFSHVPENAIIMFQSKPFKGDLSCWEFSDFHDETPEKIKPKHWCCCFKDTVYTFEPPCKIGLDDVKKEQYGVWIQSTKKDIKDLYIEEAYFGKKTNIRNIFCCGKQKYTLLCSKKPEKQD